MTYTNREVRIPLKGIWLEGDLTLLDKSKGLVIFAHGSGSSRLSPRNRHVARLLQEAGFSTFLFDLLTREEEESEARTGHLRFDIGFLAGRLLQATDWVMNEKETRDLPAGYFGASTGAAAALVASVRLPGTIEAIVSRGGRPDLAEDYLGLVKAPTLLIVGGRDDIVITLNREAFEKISAEKELVIIPGATHLFEEPGALEKVADLASGFFNRFLLPTVKEEKEPVGS